MKVRFYDPGLDVVRAIACIFVLSHHIISRIISAPDNFTLQVLNNFSLGGGLGVVYFFTLSSYLLTKIFLNEQKNTGKISLKRFLIRRQLRIYPLYFFYLALLGILAFFVFPFNCLPPSEWQIGSLVLFFYNWIDWLPNNPSSLAAILWSVCLEEQFYFILVAIVALFGVKKFPSIALAFIAIGLFSRVVVLALHLPYPAIWKITPCHFDSFGIGMLAACIESKAKISIPKSFKVLIVALALASPALFVSRYGMATYSGSVAIFSYLWCAVMAIALCWSLSGIDPRSIAGKLIVTITIYWGQRSYGIYVYHWFFLYFIPFLLHPASNTLTAIDGVLIVTLTAIASIVSYRYIEKPFLKLKNIFL